MNVAKIYASNMEKRDFDRLIWAFDAFFWIFHSTTGFGGPSADTIRLYEQIAKNPRVVAILVLMRKALKGTWSNMTFSRLSLLIA